MSDQAPSWVVPAMRAGYAARAAVYTVVGGLALLAAWRGGAAQGTTNALADLKDAPWGVPLLLLIALGLWCYTGWRLIDAWLDLECHGSGAKGIVARLGQAVTGVIHGAIGMSVALTALGRDTGGDGTQSATAKLMSLPWGPTLVACAGVATIGAGIYYARKGLREDYRNAIRETQLTRKLDPAMKFGFVAQGVVVAIVGATIFYAGITHNPGEAGGLGRALGEVRSLAFGRVLLGVVALGLVGFALENLIEAIYRIVPRRAGPDVMSLARRAKLEAEGKLREAASQA